MTPSGGRAQPRLGLSVAATSFGFALVQLDVTIINVALPAMAADLRIGTAGLQWIVDAYALVFAALLLSAGYLSDVLGARRVYLLGLTIFTAASLVCGAAPGGGGLVAARAIQGIGAAAMLPSSLALLNHACAGNARLRGWAVGWWTSSASTALASGPLIGGLLIHLLGWRFIFLVNLPLGLLAAAMALRLPEPEVEPGRRIDVPGQVLGAAALAASTAAVIEASPLGLDSPFVWGAATIAVLAGVGFVVAERCLPDPMLPGRLFATPTMSVSLLFGMVINFAYYGLVFVLSLYLQTVIGLDAVHAGLAFLPLTLTFLAVNTLSGWVAGRSGPRMPMIVGSLVAAIGYALLLRLDAHSTIGAMLPAFLLIPAGMGFVIPAMTAGVLASVERTLSGTASAVLNAARQAGGVMGVAVFGALASHSVADGLHRAALTATLLVGGLALLAVWRLPRLSS